tara:strand:- start:418 stop:846 length:429 start_codon:yes stop_codon:yes gene_type:complete
MIWAIHEDHQWKNGLDKQMSLINDNDTIFKPWLDKYKYFDRFPEKNQEFYKNQCSKFLKKYNEMVSSKSFLLGESLMLADAAIFPFVRQCAHIDLEWFENSFPYLNQWLDAWKKSNLFLSVMNKYQEWRPENSLEIINFNKN